MLERFTRRMDHSEALHHASRAHVVGRRDADNLVETQPVKPIANHGLRSFGRIAPPPAGEDEAPRDLDARDNPSVEVGARQSDQADEFVVARYEETTETVVVPVRELLVEPCAAPFARVRNAECSHDARILVERFNGVAIPRAKRAKTEALGAKLDDIGHSSDSQR
jgi:hypothetical protein